MDPDLIKSRNDLRAPNAETHPTTVTPTPELQQHRVGVASSNGKADYRYLSFSFSPAWMVYLSEYLRAIFQSCRQQMRTAFPQSHQTIKLALSGSQLCFVSSIPS